MKDVTEKKQGLLCASVAANSAAGDPHQDIIVAARGAEAYADIIEIRLDSIANPGINIFVSEIHKPLLFTNRPVWEGGAYEGNEKGRISLLLDALQAGAAYVDIEMKTASELRRQVIDAAVGTKAQVIVSWHNFEATPSAGDLEKIFLEQQQSGARIGKIITIARNPADVLRILDLLPLAAEKSFPLIAFCMGPAGIVSRVATVELGGYMTYAATDNGAATAPGQMKVSLLRSILQSIRDQKQ
jgi:3-dehydroquinate dehydratase-1/3-dehydroquinate dehydratase/shikimate dehydrogenase